MRRFVIVSLALLMLSMVCNLPGADTQENCNCLYYLRGSYLMKSG